MTDGLREQKKQLTHTSILREAALLFEKNGYATTGMEQIASAAMVSRATLFNYFTNKDAILLALADSFENAYPQQVIALCEQPDSTRHRIITAFTLAADYFTQHRQLNQAIYGELLRARSANSSANNAAVKGYREAYKNILQAGIKQGDLRMDVKLEAMVDLLVSNLVSNIYLTISSDVKQLKQQFKVQANLLADAICTDEMTEENIS
jgi:AcrR family transcriptional regulator